MNSKFKLFLIVAGVVIALCLITLLYVSLTCNGNAEQGITSSTPDPTNTAHVDAVVEYDFAEDVEKAAVVTEQNGKFNNKNVLQYTYNEENDTISIGVNIGESSDAIYINLQSSAANKDSPVGFYLTTKNGYLFQYRQEHGSTQELLNTGIYNILLGRTYDLGNSSEFKDQSFYGSMWTNDVAEGTEISVRAINLSEENYGQLLTTFRIIIEYDAATESYSIVDAYNSDVSTTGDLSVAERQRLVEDAVDFVHNTDRNSRAIMFDNVSRDWDISITNAIVEKVPMTYFTKLYDTSGNSLIRGKSINYELFAVSFPLQGFGFVTMYYAPALQIIGLQNPYEPGSTDLNLELYGYDAFYPFSQDTLDSAGFNAE